MWQEQRQVIPMLTIRDVMVSTVVTVEPQTPLKDVAQSLVDHRISGMPVVDADGAVLGVVSEADVLLKEGGADAIQHRSLARVRGESRETRAQLAKVAASTAGEAMTAPAITIGPDGSIAEAAALMIGRRVNRLPVVEDGRLVGIVSRADLVRAFIRSDDELARTIREDVLLRVLWLDPALFTVEVVDGVASGQRARGAPVDHRDDRALHQPGARDRRCGRLGGLVARRQPARTRPPGTTVELPYASALSGPADIGPSDPSGTGGVAVDVATRTAHAGIQTAGRGAGRDAEQEASDEEDPLGV